MVQVGNVSKTGIEKSLSTAYSAAGYYDDFPIVSTRRTGGLVPECEPARTGPLVHEPDRGRLQDIPSRGIRSTPSLT